MANPTNPFNWQMPTATDLVTDLPADFETFGQAVATSMADLLGGTTGQVLSKASNTDMDFTWVAQDDSNAIQNAIVDAKGDLIAASAADTPARLAVGANGETLVADSSTATGLDWKTAAEQYPWTSFTPTTNNITVGNGSRVGRYQQIGKTVHCYFNFTFGTTSAFTGQISFNVPVTPSASLAFVTLFYGTAYDYGAASYPLSWTMVGSTVYGAPTNAAGTYAQATPDVNATVPFTFGNLDSVSAYITYEAA